MHETGISLIGRSSSIKRRKAILGTYYDKVSGDIARINLTKRLYKPTSVSRQFDELTRSLNSFFTQLYYWAVIGEGGVPWWYRAS